MKFIYERQVGSIVERFIIEDTAEAIFDNWAEDELFSISNVLQAMVQKIDEKEQTDAR